MKVASWCNKNVSLLLSGTDRERELAAGQLWQVVEVNSEYRDALMGAGALARILEMLDFGSSSGRLHAAGLLRALAFNNLSYQDMIVEAGVLPSLLNILQNGPEDLKEQVVGIVAYLAAISTQHRQEVVMEGFVGPLVDVLRSTEAVGRSKEHAALALQNVMLKSIEHERIVVQAGAVIPLVTLLRSGTPSEQEQAAAALRSMVINNIAEHEREIVAADAVPALIHLLATGNRDVQTQVARALTCLVDRMVEFMASEEPRSQEQGVWGILHLSATTTQHRKVIEKEGALPCLLKLLEVGTEVGKERAISSIINLVADNTNLKIEVVDGGGVALIVEFLQPDRPDALKATAAEALSHLAYHTNREHWLPIKEAGAIELLVDLMEAECIEVQIQAIRTLRKMSEDVPSLVKDFKEHNIQHFLMRMLNRPNETAQLEALDIVRLLMMDVEDRNSLMRAGAGDTLHALAQGASTPEVREKAATILSSLQRRQSAAAGKS